MMGVRLVGVACDLATQFDALLDDFETQLHWEAAVTRVVEEAHWAATWQRLADEINYLGAEAVE